MNFLRTLIRHRIRLFFFFVGLCIQLVGLLIEYSDNVPHFYKFIAPSYYHASAGFHLLLDTINLYPSQDGFKEIAKICLDQEQARWGGELKHPKVISITAHNFGPEPWPATDEDKKQHPELANLVFLPVGYDVKVSFVISMDMITDKRNSYYGQTNDTKSLLRSLKTMKHTKQIVTNAGRTSSPNAIFSSIVNWFINNGFESILTRANFQPMPS